MKHRNRKGSSRQKPISRAERRAIAVICAALAVILLALACYAAGWYIRRARIISDAGRYRAMYDPLPVATASPTPVPTSTPTALPAASPTPTASPTAAPTPAVTDTPAPTDTHTPEPTAMPTVAPDVTQAPIVVDELIPTPNAGTLVYALPTPPPVQESFAALIEHNPDTVGFLEIGDMLSLPVVQRENDNDYYLGRNFDGEEAVEGALFLDGLNRLVPEDDCLIVYGHNMKNGTMFGRLDEFEALKSLKAHPVIRFDTIYENRLYVPFAAFTASMQSDDRHYFDVRQFIFDETGFELFTLKMQTRSVHDIPVDVRYGDRLLLLVTCDYTNRQGRFILGLRQLRPGETEADMRALFDEM